MSTTPVERALSYHTRTKHRLDRYARALGYLDWSTQPDPFRTFEGAPRLLLPLRASGLTAAYRDLYRPGAVPTAAVDLESIAALFELSLGLSAWKETRGSRWALRCNPSSGNLHPTEGYLLLAGAPGVPAGLYHYVSRDHALERRATLDPAAARALAGLFPAGSFVVGLSSVHWREAWKYGERAFRYCQHDAGHALAAIRYAAAALGWSAVLLDDLGDAELSALLGLDRDADFAGIAAADREHPDAALLLVPAAPLAPTALAAARAVGASAAEVIRVVAGGAWAGRANALSPSHVDWDVIEDAALATWKPHTEEPAAAPEAALPPLAGGVDGADGTPGAGALASEVIRTRRSATAFDGHTSIGAETFYAMLDRLLPRPGVPPWDALPWAPLVHAVVFVHRVRGLAQGLYVLERSEAAHERLRAALAHPFDWERPEGCPDHLRLYRLSEADLRGPAQIVSCHQEIAADGAFSLGMVADFGATLRERGAPWYRRLFWEAGVLGHALYLEAEAARDSGGRVRATGIGCYFDDVFHELCGITGDAFQSLYHFTVGGPVEDVRLMTRAPYEHLEGERREPDPR
ncbi:nitroreductase family protein [Sorangium cellulosum]|uniref:Nitroreductase n=1 Tax=Sorangium cellulosum TaxID=56 RepID=A0A150QSD0_SORCE|nr:nitroreductase family protein [Sorangium cellulosum]KYF70927.1 nitroreductase [Sorangium cellulosum]